LFHGNTRSNESILHIRKSLILFQAATPENHHSEISHYHHSVACGLPLGVVLSPADLRKRRSSPCLHTSTIPTNFSAQSASRTVASSHAENTALLSQPLLPQCRRLEKIHVPWSAVLFGPAQTDRSALRRVSEPLFEPSFYQPESLFVLNEKPSEPPYRHGQQK
jgi:hypothetical protein